MPITAETAATFLARYDRMSSARGLAYAQEGRVEIVEQAADSISATVKGSETYDVTLGQVGTRFSSSCECPAFDRTSQCKHIAALAWSLQPATTPTVIGPRLPVAPEIPIPAVIREVHTTASLFERLALYSADAIPPAVASAWTPLAVWWKSPADRHGATRELAVAQVPAIEATLEALRDWRPRRGFRAKTDIGRIHEQLADVYDRARDSSVIRKAVPGPLDERHPGFAFEYDAETRRLRVTERTTPRRIYPALLLQIPFDVRAPIRFEEAAFERPATHDAWDLFALRALLLAIEEGMDPTIKALTDELSQPLWEQMLARLAPRPRSDKEWGFTITQAWEGMFGLEVSSRAVGKTKPPAWKRATWEAVFREGAPALEQAIARAVLAGSTGKSVSLRFGTVAAHEVLRQLAQHPRVWFGDRSTKAKEPQIVTDIIVGELSVRLVRQGRGMLAPHFFVGDKEVAIPAGGRAVDASRAPYLDGMILVEHGAITVLSIEVPPPLQRWVETAARLGDAFAFPMEAIPKLAETASPLVASGMLELPREALGDELRSDARPALRVEWVMDRSEPTATVEVLVAVHPDAPLLGRGGPKLFTFERGGRRVFVERDKEHEADLVAGVLERGLGDVELTRIDATTWETADLEQTLALAAWLEANPERLRIEVKLGRPPSVHAMKDSLTDATLTVNKANNWLVFDGALTLGDTKLTLGAILEAIRQAKRFVRADNGIFLELGNELRAKLKPLAIATELAPRSDKTAEGLRIREAFGTTLADVAKLFGVVDAKVDLQDYVKRFDGREKKAKVVKLEKGELREYQKDGVAWMLALASWAPGCILADDMGLGKTIQTAAVLKARAKLGPALIVAPASVSSNWVRELGRFMPSLAVTWFNADRKDVAALGPNDVLVVSYNLLQRKKDDFAEQKWATVVLDEAQYVKNAEADRTKSVKKLKRDFTIALTGTPVENDLGELHAIVDLAFPGLLSDERVFRETFRRPIEQRGDKDRLAILGRLLGPFLLRRTRAAVLDELPAREEVTELVDLSDDERKRYLALRKVVEEDIAQRKRSGGIGTMRIELLAALTRLRQLACEVRLLDPEYQGPSTKTGRVVELATQLAGEGNAALVFSQFTSFLSLVRDALVKAGLRVAYLSGETPLPARQVLIDEFQAGKYDVFCISLLAGGTGLNLTHASYVMHLDPWWNPAAEEQATARAHRMGQKNPVTVYRLVSRGTIEEAVLKLHARKRQLASAVLEGRGEATTVSSEELLELLGVD